jgi:hypothetical protein
MATRADFFFTALAIVTSLWSLQMRRTGRFAALSNRDAQIW